MIKRKKITVGMKMKNEEEGGGTSIIINPAFQLDVCWKCATWTATYANYPRN